MKTPDECRVGWSGVVSCRSLPVSNPDVPPDGSDGGRSRPRGPVRGLLPALPYQDRSSGSGRSSTLPRHPTFLLFFYPSLVRSCDSLVSPSLTFTARSKMFATSMSSRLSRVPLGRSRPGRASVRVLKTSVLGVVEKTRMGTLDLGSSREGCLRSPRVKWGHLGSRRVRPTDVLPPPTTTNNLNTWSYLDTAGRSLATSLLSTR